MSISHDWFGKSDLNEYGGFYASVLCSYIPVFGLDVRGKTKRFENGKMK